MVIRPKTAAFLQQHLSPQMWQQVADLATTSNLFQYLPDEGVVELAENLDWQGPELSTADLDLLLYLCQLLTEEGSPEVKAELTQATNIEEHYTFYFSFQDNPNKATGNGSQVARFFLNLLQKSANFRYRSEDLADEIKVEVTITFRSDIEYQQKKSELDWLLQLARRQAGATPFRGTRL